jgi:hypothetical protein
VKGRSAMPAALLRWPLDVKTLVATYLEQARSRFDGLTLS